MTKKSKEEEEEEEDTQARRKWIPKTIEIKDEKEW